MSHDTSTGRIYIGGTQQSPIGISVADVNAIIQAGSLDVGTLCTSNNINKWPRNKPVRSSIVGILSDQNRRDAFWGLCEPIEYEGTGSTMAGHKSALLNAAQDANAYVYLKPRGLAGTSGNANNEWFRLLDFNGYYHSANQPIQTFAMPSINVPDVSGDYIDISFVKNTQNTGSITLEDIAKKLGLFEENNQPPYYIAVGFVKGNTLFYRTSTTTIKSWINGSAADIVIRFNKNDEPFRNISTQGQSEGFYVAATSGRYAYNDTNIPSDPVFRALPLGNQSEGYGNITIGNTFPVSFELQRIGIVSPLNKAFNYFSLAEDYMKAISSGGTYLNLGTTGTIAYGVKMQYNGSKTAFSFDPSMVYISSNINAITWSTTGQNAGTGARQPTIYYNESPTSTLTAASGSFNIRKNVPMYAVFYRENFFRFPNTSGSINEGQGDSRLSLYYDASVGSTTPVRWNDAVVHIKYDVNE